MLKRFLLTTVVCVFAAVGSFAQMSDSEVLAVVARETKAGTSQSQIVTKLM